MTDVYASAIDRDTCDVSCLHPNAVQPVLGRTLSESGAVSVARLFDVLADPSRARVVHLLAIADDLCVCDMALVLGISVSALSHQLRHLRERGVVERRKVGRLAYYRLLDDRLRRLVIDAARQVAEVAA